MSKESFIFDGVINWPRLIKFSDQPAPNFWREHSPNKSGILTPKYALIHYTGGGAMGGTVEWCNNHDANVSYHFLISRNGDVCQMVDTDSCAWHAGESEWDGAQYLNQFSIGIGLCNWGLLRRLDTSGDFVPYKPGLENNIIPRSRVTALPHSLSDIGIDYWESYPAKQLFSLVLLLHALTSSLPIDEALGHNEVSPGRKIDPGPAFPLAAYKQFVRFMRRFRVAR